jgi:hypothetical protein
MTLTVQMDEELARKLADEARRQGVDPQEYARRLIEEKVGRPEPLRTNRSTLDLLAQWDREDATDDPAEIARREEELRLLKTALNENRGSGRTPFP